MKTQFVVIPERTKTVPYAREVHEHRAPTDESIRLYEEIKEKAYKSILNGFAVSGNNCLSMKCIVYHEPHSFAKVCKYIVKINGQDVTGEIRDSITDGSDTNEVIQKVIEHVSVTIAQYLVRTNMQVLVFGGRG